MSFLDDSLQVLVEVGEVLVVGTPELLVLRVRLVLHRLDSVLRVEPDRQLLGVSLGWVSSLSGGVESRTGNRWRAHIGELGVSSYGSRAFLCAFGEEGSVQLLESMVVVKDLPCEPSDEGHPRQETHYLCQDLQDVL